MFSSLNLFSQTLRQIVSHGLRHVLSQSRPILRHLQRIQGAQFGRRDIHDERNRWSHRFCAGVGCGARRLAGLPGVAFAGPVPACALAGRLEELDVWEIVVTPSGMRGARLK
jgi:hypothetical protein